ncbi:hypothetical protein MWMV14_MWMV14_01619 [Acinetobacter baumannii]|nr:hypothetical protein MWMV9_MWMV9_01547 [Acinetobacter baumannii]CAI3135413.1 hypothetical protein MWMV14_MWMV14_01619 [Acinetobacter baumannii]CAI3135789.1 hypothetical protein MWMV11_MWMV11_01618 [Acinetobacter baumannii]
MTLLYFVNFMYVVIFVVSLVLSFLWVYSKKNSPYVNWFDKFLVVIFIPLILLTTFSFILMAIGYFFN